MARQTMKKGSDKWAEDAFPPEAKAHFEVISPDEVRKAVKSAHEQFPLSDFEVVEGINFPYEQFA